MENEKKGKFNVKKIVLIFVVVILAVVLLVVANSFAVISKEMNAKYVTFGEDKIPTVANLIGKKKISSVSYSNHDSDKYEKEVVYNKIDNDNAKYLKVKEIEKYISLLKKENFVCGKEFLDNNYVTKLGKEKDGFIIIVSINYNRKQKTATFTYTKKKGSINTLIDELI